MTASAVNWNLDQTEFNEPGARAEKNCPVSKLLTAAVTVDATPI
jgi:organic hydroperoxide reductase OsmC/OhrA